MKYLSLIFLLLVFRTGVAQNNITLEACKEKAVLNYPKLEQKELLQQISALTRNNTRTAYLPSVDIKGQATYQSEVIEFDLPVPGFEFDPVSKDQYKIYLDIKQNIWDGGMVKRMQDFENVVLEAKLQGLEIELLQVKGMVENTFFSIVQLNKTIEVLQTQMKVLEQQVNVLEGAILLGAGREKDRLKMELEVLSLQQKVDNMQLSQQGLYNVLALLTGENLTAEDVLILPKAKVMTNNQLRPELELFALQKKQLETSNQLIEASRNPKFFGFGQAGYGKPGFNMLKNEFDPYYIVGVGINWKVIDWKTTFRKKEINSYRRAIIDKQRADFIQKQDVQLIHTTTKMNQLESQLETDNELVKRSSQISKIAAAELENGTITSTEYIMDLNVETLAKINRELHKIQLTQSIVNYNTLLGY